MESKDQINIEHLFSKSNITSDWKRKIEIKLFIQSAFASGSHLMGITYIHLMIYFLECMSTAECLDTQKALCHFDNSFNV